jgi:hypothetical protein
MSEDLETAAEEASGFIQERAKVDASPIELAGWSEAIAITGKRFLDNGNTVGFALAHFPQISKSTLKEREQLRCYCAVSPQRSWGIC